MRRLRSSAPLMASVAPLRLASLRRLRSSAPLMASVAPLRLASLRRLRSSAIPVSAVLVLAALLPFSSAVAAQPPAEVTCAPRADVVTMTGTVGADDAKTYQMHAFEVGEGTTRVEVGYRWDAVDGTTLDLGLWDSDGYRSPEGFRGWGGSREGRLDKGMSRAWVQADSAERSFTPGEIDPGTWYVELGIAEVAPAGAAWTVELLCTDAPTGPEADPDPVDPTHVANPEPGWYRGDFHMHGFHSNPEAPDNAGFVEYARAAGLDFLPVTEYVVERHWNEWGATQRANPDLLVWPGREIITYFGHAIVLGETPSTVEYRQGFEDVTLGTIQRDVLADGATFGIAHPTTFPEAQFGNTCRGCEFQLADVVDLDRVDTIEVLTDDITFGGAQNPFTTTAIDYWESLLAEGHRITAVSGSDDKLGPGLGSSATAVYADELSRPALQRAVRAGHAYVQTRGALKSPALELTAVAPDGTEAMMGDTLVADTAQVTVTVTGGVGQRLRVLRNGTETTVVDVTADPFEYSFAADRAPDEGPLGTFWRVDTFDDVSLTTISNPVFLADAQPPEKVGATTTTTAAEPSSTPTTAAPAGDPAPSSGLRNPFTALALVVAAVFGLIIARRALRRREEGG